MIAMISTVCIDYQEVLKGFDVKIAGYEDYIILGFLSLVLLVAIFGGKKKSKQTKITDYFKSKE
jgi:predicted permease